MPTPCPPPTPVPCPPGLTALERAKRTRFAPSERKPRTPEEVAEFIARIQANAETHDELGRSYGVEGRTIRRWAVEFGVGGARCRSGALRGPIRASARELATATAGTMEALAQAARQVGLGSEADPRADPEVAALLEEARAAVANTRVLPDLAQLQRIVLKLLFVLLQRMPVTSATLFWSGMELSRLVLQTRRVEAMCPPSTDPVALRQQAARELLQELRAVLPQEKQDQLASLLREGAALLRIKRDGERLPVGSGDAVTQPTS